MAPTADINIVIQTVRKYTFPEVVVSIGAAFALAISLDLLYNDFPSRPEPQPISSPAPLKYGVGEITFTKNDVRAKRHLKDRWSAVTPSSQIVDKTALYAGRFSRAGFQFHGGSAVETESNTLVVLRKNHHVQLGFGGVRLRLQEFTTMTLSAGDSFITVKSFDPAEVLVRKFEYSVSINALSGQPIIERNGRRSALRSTPLVFLVNPIKGLNQHYAIKEMEEHTDEDFTEESDSTPARMIVRASES